MRHFIAFILLFLTHSIVPTTVSAMVNVKNSLTHSRTTPLKRLSFKERVVGNYARLKAKFKSKISVEALAFGVAGLVGLLFGILLIAKANRNQSNSQPQGGVGNEASGFTTVLGVVAVAIGAILFLIAIVISI